MKVTASIGSNGVLEIIGFVHEYSEANGNVYSFPDKEFCGEVMSGQYIFTPNENTPNEGHLSINPDWVDPSIVPDIPVGPDPIDYSSVVVQLTEQLADAKADNTALSQSVVQLTDFVASLATKEE